MHRKSFVVTVLSLLLVIGNGCSQPRHLAIGERLEKMGRYGDALGAYQAALSQAKDKDGKLQSTVYYRMGECLLQLDRAQEAFQAFSNAVEADSNNTGARLRLGEILLSAGAPDRAREQAEAAMLRSPRNGEAVALWGASMEGIGRLDKARDAYREALSLEPDRVSVAIALADLYNQNNETTQAREVLEQSAKANPKSASPWLAMARLNEQAGETKAAESAYRRAIQVEDTPETNLRLAQFLQRTSRIAESEQVLRRVDAQRPTEPTALADFQLMAGRPTNALGSYQAALGRETQRTNARTTPDR